MGSLVSVQMMTGAGEGTPGNQLAFDKCLLKSRLYCSVSEGWVKHSKSLQRYMCL